MAGMPASFCSPNQEFGLTQGEGIICPPSNPCPASRAPGRTVYLRAGFLSVSESYFMHPVTTGDVHILAAASIGHCTPLDDLRGGQTALLMDRSRSYSFFRDATMPAFCRARVAR